MALKNVMEGQLELYKISSLSSLDNFSNNDTEKKIECTMACPNPNPSEIYKVSNFVYSLPIIYIFKIFNNIKFKLLND